MVARNPAVAVAYVGGWLVFFVARLAGSFLALEVILLILSSAAVGWSIRRWWSLLLPALVLPLFASPLPYEPGGEPDYGIGLVVAIGFALFSIPSVFLGVAGAKLARRASRT